MHLIHRLKRLRKVLSQQALDQFIGIAGQAGALEIAQIYAWRGDKDQAFEWLDRAYQQHDSNLYGLKCEGVCASLRDDARFAALRRKMNRPATSPDFE
jgi:hypothetical protein